MSNRLPFAIRHGLVLVVVVLGAASCTGANIVKDYGPEAKQNFVNACEQDRTVVDGEIVHEKLAPRSTCVCIYESIYKEFRLPWDDLADYESAVADAPAGDPPDMPKQLQKAITKCTTSGPSAPSVTTTTQKPG